MKILYCGFNGGTPPPVTGQAPAFPIKGFFNGRSPTQRTTPKNYDPRLKPLFSPDKQRARVRLFSRKEIAIDEGWYRAPEGFVNPGKLSGAEGVIPEEGGNGVLTPRAIEMSMTGPSIGSRAPVA